MSAHPLELHDDIAWDTYCPVSRLGEHVGEEVVTCGLVVEQRTHHQITGEPMKFLTLADWTGMVETELFAATYRSYGLATVRYPVLEITAKVEPFENGRGFSLRAMRAAGPRKAQMLGEEARPAWPALVRQTSKGDFYRRYRALWCLVQTRADKETMTRALSGMVDDRAGRPALLAFLENLRNENPRAGIESPYVEINELFHEVESKGGPQGATK